MKKAQDFLLDTQLGSQSFSLDQNQQEKETIVLSIESAAAIPASLLAQSQKKLNAKMRIGLYTRLDEWFQSLGKPNARDKATFFRLFAIMINAGIPVIKSLETIAEQSTNVRLRRMLFDIARGIEKGATLSECQARSPDFFSDAEIGMIKAAEASGQLNVILKDLAHDVETQAKLKQKVRGALLYPAFVVTIMITVVAGMMIGVVPKVAEIFATSGRALPYLTTVVITISNFMTRYWLHSLAVLIVFIAVVSAYRKTGHGKYTFDWIALRSPFFGAIIKKSLLARFSRMLSNLLKSGVPITHSLSICARSIGNMVYSERIDLISEDIVRGIPLGEALRDTPEFPPMVVQMVAVGEQTAQLDSMSAKIAEVYEDEVDTLVASLTKILEPILIVILGIVVAMVVFAMMMPIMQLSNLTP